MFIAGLQTLRITFDDASVPTKATWENKSFATTSRISLDPILFTDRTTGRTFVSQLISGNGLGLGCSLTAYTDDDGDNWIQSEGCGLPLSGADHQSMGGGVYHAPLTRDESVPLYPHAVYYCSQATVTAFCARSDDGGTTFGPGVTIYTTECGGIHGHPMVAPDGTVYLPNRGCGAKQGVAVSEDNGISWQIRRVPDSIQAANDPGVGIGAGGTVYFG
ncbi:MAG: sialidase family protein [Pyrinomonadaceae bacterium]